MDLAVGHVCVLFGWVEEETGTGIVVVAENDLFTWFVFGREVFEGEGVCAVFSPPGQGALESGEGVIEVPF